MSERRIMERFDEIMAGFDKHPYARLMERNTALEMLVIKQRDLLDECERALAFYVAEENWYMDGPLNPDSHKFTGGPARDMLDKLRAAQEKADE